MWPAITIEPPAPRSQLSIEVDTEFHRARHGRSRTQFAGARFAGSFVSVIPMAHKVALGTIDWPISITSALVAAIFSHAGAAQAAG